MLCICVRIIASPRQIKIGRILPPLVGISFNDCHLYPFVIVPIIIIILLIWLLSRVVLGRCIIVVTVGSFVLLIIRLLWGVLVGGNGEIIVIQILNRGFVNLVFLLFGCVVRGVFLGILEVGPLPLVLILPVL